MIGQRTAHPRRWAAAAGLVAMGLTASCGVRVDSTRTVGTTGAHQHPAASGQVVQASLARQAAAATSALRTGRFTITISGTGMPSGTGLSGAYDLDHKALEMDTSTGGSGTRAAETLIVDGKMYVKVPAGLATGLTKPWMVVTLPGMSGLGSSPMGTMDPQELLGRLKAVTGGLTVVGHETIDGVDTTHYRGTIDPSKLTSKVGGAAPAVAAGHLGSVPVDVWIDGQGLIRRQQMSDEGTAAGQVKITIDFTDLGGPVTITAPPADQVQAFDPSQLMKSLGSGSSLPGAPAN